MGTETAIAWTDHTFNPWMGCTKVSPGCDNCYAEALGKRTGRVEWGDHAERVVTSDAYWRNPLKWNHDAAAGVAGVRGVGRHLVFCASLADVFEDRDDLFDDRQRLFDLIGETPHLDWQLLTKRPQNVLGMVPDHWLCEGVEEWETGEWPDNVWIGVTVEDQERAEERVPVMLEIPAAVRFLSCEPLLGSVVLWPEWLWQELHAVGSNATVASPAIGWVIAGGESGAGHRPLDLDHARALRDQCVGAGVPFFFKQVGGRTPKAGGKALDGREWCEFPEVATCPS